MEIGKIIQFYRKKKGLSREKLAEKLFMSSKTIASYETGTRTPSIETVKLIAGIFEMKVQDLFHESKVKEDIRKSEIKKVAATITKEYDNKNNVVFWVEIDVPETGEILEEYTSVFYFTLEEAEDYIENIIEKEFEVLYYHEKDLTDIVSVMYVSVWDSGYTEIRSNAKYDRENNLVFDVESKDVDGLDLEICEREYIILPDETELDVVKEEEEYMEELKNRKMVLLKW